LRSGNHRWFAAIIRAGNGRGSSGRVADLITSPYQQARTVLAGAWCNRQLDAGCGSPVQGRICGGPAFIERGEDGTSLLIDLSERDADWKSQRVSVGGKIGVDLVGLP